FYKSVVVRIKSRCDIGNLTLYLNTNAHRCLKFRLINKNKPIGYRHSTHETSKYDPFLWSRLFLFSKNCENSNDYATKNFFDHLSPFSSQHVI
ncbi:hypothetical protein RI129_000408, partial [Pyrocoelia pectoralis]